MPEKRDHWDGETGNDEACGVGGDLTVGRDAGSLVRILRHDGRQRGIGHVVDNVYDAQQGVRDPSVDEFGTRTDVRRRERQDADDAERHGCPEEPGPELAPSCSGAVGDQTHDRIDGSGTQANHQKERPCLGRSKAEGVGVEVQLKCNHELEDEVCSHVAKAVTELLFERESCSSLSHVGDLFS